MGSASMDPAVKHVHLMEGEIRQLCTVAEEIFLRQPNLLGLETPIKFRAAKAPHLEYGIIKKHNNGPPSTSTHPPPVNGPTRSCNAENFCRHFTLSVENTSGTRVEAVGFFEVGAPLNSSELGTEAIAAAIAEWWLSKTNGNTSGRLSVSMDPIADVDSAHMLQLRAVSRGIANMELDVEYRNASMSAEDVASLPPVDGNIAITVDTAANQVGLKFFTHVESLGESDLVHILEHAKAKLQAIHK